MKKEISGGIPPAQDDVPYFVLTYQTDKHDFYTTKSGPKLFNIVPKGSLRPTSGYPQSRGILDVKGYGRIPEHQVFH